MPRRVSAKLEAEGLECEMRRECEGEGFMHASGAVHFTCLRMSPLVMHMRLPRGIATLTAPAAQRSHTGGFKRIQRDPKAGINAECKRRIQTRKEEVRRHTHLRASAFFQHTVNKLSLISTTHSHLQSQEQRQQQQRQQQHDVAGAE